jgi:hypothetical protein
MRSYLTEIMDTRFQVLIQRSGVEREANQSGFISTLAAGLVVDALTWWLEQDKPYPPRQLAIYCFHLIIAMLQQVRTWEQPRGSEMKVARPSNDS